MVQDHPEYYGKGWTGRNARQDSVACRAAPTEAIETEHKSSKSSSAGHIDDDCDPSAGSSSDTDLDDHQEQHQASADAAQDGATALPLMPPPRNALEPVKV